MRSLLLVYLSCLCLCSGCGPGRGGIRRRGARKLTPLVYKQHYPNFSERSLAASGLPEGIVDRTMEKFRRLVVNYNPDIIFKDEEGTGADRLMTQRCKEKLNTLAISVMNQWPGINLRVTEAWDEDLHHAAQSLHYEGRAVDLTTSDRDKKKYGMLARLAVESGFDWVYFESRSHIHASCKSEAQHPGKDGGCFKGSSTVMLSSGKRKQLSDLVIGDEVLSVSDRGEFTFSPVLLFLDRDLSERRQFYTIHTESGQSITMTPSHLIYVLANDDDDSLDNVVDLDLVDFEAVFARQVREGDLVLVTGLQSSADRSKVAKVAGPLRASKVTRVEVEVHSGVFAPLTAEGNLVVDNVLVSCYAVLDSQTVAHTAFGPVRWFEGAKRQLRSVFGGDNDADVSGEKKEDFTGIHWYADVLYSVARYVMPSHLR